MTVQIESLKLEENWFELKVYAPELSIALPGQYMIIQVSETSERIPLMITGVWSWGVSALLKIRGKSTLFLSRAKEAFCVTGPLGRPFPLESCKKALIYVESWGLAAAIPLARAFRALGTESYLIYKNIQMPVIERYRELFDKIQQKPESKDIIICAGSNELSMQISQSYKDSKVIALVDAPILDGIGLCLVCRVKLGNSYKLACCEGPWFNAHEVSWQELIARQRAYEELEKKSYEEALKRLSVQRETS
ncbi:MAG: hypothetical protein ABDH18_00220 [Aquificaceae bacterium]